MKTHFCRLYFNTAPWLSQSTGKKYFEYNCNICVETCPFICASTDNVWGWRSKKKQLKKIRNLLNACNTAKLIHKPEAQNHWIECEINLLTHCTKKILISQICQSLGIKNLVPWLSFFVVLWSMSHSLFICLEEEEEESHSCFCFFLLMVFVCVYVLWVSST